MNGRTKLNEIYDKLGDELFSFIELYEHIDKESIGIHQVVNLFKIAEEMPFLEARYQRIKDSIDADTPKILELNRRKLSSVNELKSMLDELQSFREYRDNELKSLQENIDKLQHEEQELTCRIQRLNNEELEILRLVESTQTKQTAARPIYSRITTTNETTIGNYSTST